VGVFGERKAHGDLITPVQGAGCCGGLLFRRVCVRQSDQSDGHKRCGHFCRQRQESQRHKHARHDHQLAGVLGQSRRTHALHPAKRAKRGTESRNRPGTVGDPGQLQSNGRVYLINPNGITIGAGARIDTAGFVASSLKLSDSDALAGKFKLQDSGSSGKVVNNGTIATTSGGFVYLIAPDVENNGVINSPKGEIILAAGKSVELVDSQKTRTARAADRA